MSVKRMLSLFVLVTSLLFCSQICYAAEDNTLLQGYAWENYADLYISDDINMNTVTVNVSNQPAEMVDGGLLTDKGVTIRTTILLDISASMPKSMRSSVTDYISNYIETLISNEQLRIITFGEKITVLQEFTSDRYDLSKAVSEIKFEGQQSMIYDAVYNTIPELGLDNNSPCYYRTIVITDGSDESDQGITKEELFLKLRESFYPVEVIAVSGSDNTSIDKDLTALTRISGGRSFTMRPGADAANMTLGVDSITWIRIKLPDTVLDGSTRQFNIKDNEADLQFDFKVPVFASNSEMSENQKEEILKDEIKKESTEVNEIPSDHEENVVTEEENSENLILNYIVIVAIIIVLAIAVVTAFILLRKKSSSGAAPNDLSRQSGETEILTGGTSIRLRKIDDPDKIWNLMLSDTDTVEVGREKNCQVFLNESSVSRLQCIIYSDHTGSPMIENRSNSNSTQVNRIKITNPQKLSDGDQIRCGRVVLMVDSIMVDSSAGDKSINKMTEFVNV